VASPPSIANAFLTIGANRVLGGKGAGSSTSPGRCWWKGTHPSCPGPGGIELLEDLEPDARSGRVVPQAEGSGYTLALDEVIAPDSRLRCNRLPSTPTRLVADGGWGSNADLRPFPPAGIRAGREGGEPRTSSKAALACGCELFQGFYFARPEILSARQVPTSEMACLRLLSKFKKPI